jgi:hypothetical protein
MCRCRARAFGELFLRSARAARFRSHMIALSGPPATPFGLVRRHGGRPHAPKGRPEASWWLPIVGFGCAILTMGTPLPSLTAGTNLPPQWVTMASLILREAVEQTGATPGTIVTNDVGVAFAALQVELTSLLGRIPELRANEEIREYNHESRSSNATQRYHGQGRRPTRRGDGMGGMDC